MASDYLKPHTDLVNFIPERLRNKMNSSLMRNLFNRFLTKEETLPLYGVIGKKSLDPDDIRPEITQSSLERKVNALLPLINGQVGIEQHLFSYEDIIAKCRALGIDVDNMISWSKAQGFNFAPPIDLDKFMNFSNYRWVAKAINATPSIWNPNNDPEYYVIAPTNRLAAGSPFGDSDWALSNYWIHVDDLSFYGIQTAKTIQAIRPIIEYDAAIDLNEYISAVDGSPSTTGIPVPQTKTTFNQLPYFNLYHYDGTHAKMVSPIFYYQEGAEYEIDQHLMRRVKANKTGNFIFAQGLISDDRCLFYKTSSLHSVWEPGPLTPSVTTPTFAGFGNGTCSFPNAIVTAPHETWTLTALSSSSFKVQGSKTGVTAPVTVGASYDNGIVSFTIDNNLNPIPFLSGDTFKFTVNNIDVMRYVTQDAEGNVFNYPGGPTIDVNNEGAWLTPPQLFYNPEHENREEHLYGDLVNHFKTIISEQLALTGSSFGRNNYRNIGHNLGFGGRTKEFNGAFNLFVSLMNQRDLTPITIIDFAEYQYAQAINSLTEYFTQNILTFISENGSFLLSDNDHANPQVANLFQEYETTNATYHNKSLVFSDSTNPISNWPATLPLLGLAPKVLPIAAYDRELNINVIVHHDGHLSPLNVRDVDFDRSLVKVEVERSDGTMSPGIFSNTPPQQPYKNQLWFKSSTNELFSYNVISDNVVPAEFPPLGTYWYDRSADILYQWNGTTWITATITDAWEPIHTDLILNSFILHAENVIYDAVHPEQELYTAVTSPTTMQIELAKFSSKYGYDPFAPDYDPYDPFTWNYKSVLPYARWYSNYTATLWTSRPNLEPWKILGNPNKPIGWDVAWASPYQTIDSNVSIAPVKYVMTTNISVNSAPLTNSNNTFSVNDRILVLGQTNQTENGIYVVQSPGIWVRASDAMLSSQFVPNLNVAVTNDYEWKGTVWVLTTPQPITLTITPITFAQVRRWSDAMWADIKATVLIPLCVNTHTDELLPPYVDSNKWESSEALLTAIPTGISDSYIFGDLGPTELVWTKSLEYNYGLLRASFKLDPINFLDSTWGHSYISVNDFQMDKQRVKKLSHKDFQLHGESIINTTSRVVSDHLSYTVVGTLTATVELAVSYSSTSKTIFTVFVDGVNNGNIELRTTLTTPIVLTGGSIINLLITDTGIPFEFGDKFVLDFNNSVSPIISFVPALYKKFFGLNQFYTHLLRFNSIDEAITFNSVMFRKWDINLGYRTDGLIRTDDLIVKSDVFTIPSTGFKPILKVNSLVKNTWLSAIRVQLVTAGDSEISYVGDYGKPINQASNWVFRIETYTPSYPTIRYDVLDTNGDFVTFNALSKANSSDEWKNYQTSLTAAETTAPLFITGVQNVVTFLFGYVKRLERDGWKFNQNDLPETDSETGRTINWQLEIEKFIDSVYNNLQVGQGYILNPFMKNIWFETSTGLVSNFNHAHFADALTSQLVFDTLGRAIPVESLRVIREDDVTLVSSDVPIFAAHFHTDEYEHTLLFDNYLEQETRSGLIYDSFLGLKVNRLQLSGQKQLVDSRRPSYGGFYLHDNQVFQNIESSVDGIANYYDSTANFNNATLSRQALALLGFNKKPYFTDLGVADKSQFGFWQGMIQTKGSSLPIDAYLNSSKFKEARIDEYWAYKVAEYGDARTQIYPELKINARDCNLKFTRLQFHNAPTDVDSQYSAINAFTQINADDDDRWFSIDDLGSHLYFEAEVVGSTSVSVPPVITLGAKSPGNTADIINYSVEINKSTPAGVYRISFIDSVNFSVVDPSSLVIGSGSIDTPFTDVTTGISFTVTESVSPLMTGDWLEFTVWLDLSTQDFTDLVESSLTQFPLVKLPFIADYFETGTFVTRASASSVFVTKANTPFSVIGYVPAKPKFDPIKLFDYVDDVHIEDISTWHPAFGTHEPLSLQVINITSNVDQAKYNYSTQSSRNASYSPLHAWGEREVGRVWWDTSNLGYVPYYDDKIFENYEERLARWGSLADWASIDVYEWVSSDVPPTEYDALALVEEGSTEIDVSIRKSGIAGKKQTYKRNRNWSARPIAWSYTTNPTTSPHPSFTSSFFSKLYVSSTAAGPSSFILDRGRAADYGLIAGQKLSAWNYTDDLPEGEALIGSAVDYVIGSEDDYLSPTVVPDLNFSSISVSSALEILVNGSIIFTAESIGGLDYITATELGSGLSQTLQVEDTLALTKIELDFSLFGISLIGITANNVTALEVATALGNPLHDIYVRERISSTIEIDFPSNELINDLLDPGYVYMGWRAWTVPTQAQLSSDLLAPLNSWMPIYGNYVEQATTSDFISQVQAFGRANLTSNTELITKYTSSWSMWEALSNQKQSVISTGNPISFTFDSTIVPSRLLVYVNGAGQLKSAYTVDDDIVSISGIDAGHEVVAIYQKYEPTSDELKFDPTVAENQMVQVQYKADYQYVVVNVRDTDGNIASQKYYFWVKNKATPAKLSNYSIQQVTNLLKSGASTYLTFQNVQPKVSASPSFPNGLPVRYDAIAVSGLNRYVTKDDAFKLRFTRNFVLRDDPQQLDLKNVHTEWQLIRPQHAEKIPLSLWEIITVAAAGQDNAGNPLPSIRRIDYDARHNTRTRYGFNKDQIFAESSLVKNSIVYTIQNTTLEKVHSGINISDTILSLEGKDLTLLFGTASSIKETMDLIWRTAKPRQINEIFFAVLNDALANNYEFTDIFKTSRLSAHSIRTITPPNISEYDDYI